jgi:hypothetical protein
VAYDYSDAPRERELIPGGTIVTCVLHIRPGNAGENGMLKRNKEGTCEMLDLEFTVASGEYAKRKVWEYWVLSGTTSGHEEAATISRGRLRQVLESALGIRPDDMSPEARAARTVGLEQFDGMNFVARIGVENARPKDKNNPTGETWPAKNTIAAIITPDKREWQAVEQPPPFNGSGGAAASPQSAPPALPVNKPDWA